MANARDRIEDAKPYVKRAIEDEALRENLRSAFATARGVYDELIANRGVAGVATKVATDQEIQDQLRSAIQDLRDAADRIQGHREHKGRNSTLLLTGIALGILFNPLTGPETRRWLKDKIFGEDEEFGYGSSGNGSLGLGARGRNPSDRVTWPSVPRARAAIARCSEPGSSPLAAEMSETCSTIAAGFGAGSAIPVFASQLATFEKRTSWRCFHASR